MKNNTVLAIVFLMAGTLLTTTAITTMVPAAYADNENEAEDESAASLADCDENEVERAGFDCVAVAEIGENGRQVMNSIGTNSEEASQFEEAEEEEEERERSIDREEEQE